MTPSPTKITPKDAPLQYISLSTLVLKKGESYTYVSTIHEAVFVLLSGQCHVSMGPDIRETIGERSSVFHQLASAVYVPLRICLSITALKSSHMVLCDVKTAKTCPAAVIHPGDVRRRVVGEGIYKRDVYDVIGADFCAGRILLGETRNPRGQWSSYPPHKHDRDDPPRQSDHEEVYFFQMYPRDGFGLQMMYGSDQNFKNVETFDLKRVVHNDVTVIRSGYHPVFAPPTTDVYYLWVLAGSQRRLHMYEDESFSMDIAQR